MPTTRVTWPRAWRVIASRYPPIRLFERAISDPAAWDALIALEQLTNPRLRDEAGDISLVPAAERVSGPGAGYVMASFTHLNRRGSRFSDGDYGVYYAARELDTAVAETMHHFERFARDARQGPRTEGMRVLTGAIDADLADVSLLPDGERAALLDPDSYAASQPWGRARREEGRAGILYDSVRLPGGQCVGLLRPRAVGLPVQERHLAFHWDGHAATRWFDYGDGRWRARPGADPEHALRLLPPPG